MDTNLSRLVEVLQHGTYGDATSVSVASPTGESVTVPPELATLLRDVTRLYAAGSSPLVLPARGDMTTTQAGKALGVSRHSMVDMLESGRVPFHWVGRHRRVRVVDVLAERRRQDRDAGEAAREARLAVFDEVRETQVPSD